MQKKRFQNKIAESRFSLTVTALLCLSVWLLAGLGITPGGWNLGMVVAHPEALLTHPMLVALPSMAVSTYLMVELNNSYALIRIYSRMVSCTFLVLSTMTVFLFLSARASVVTLCAIGFYAFAFRCYQDNRSPGWLYYAYLCVGVASTFFVQVLFFLPILWVLTATKLMAMSLRTFCASLLGLATPYWFWCGYAFLTSKTNAMVSHLMGIAEFEDTFRAILNLQMSELNLHHVATGAFVLLLALIGIVHYLHTRQNDRIRTQMLYEIFVVVDTAAILFLLLQPQHYRYLLGIIIVNTSPLIAHFIALTQTKWTNLLTKVLILLSVLITILNLWEPSLRF